MSRHHLLAAFLLTSVAAAQTTFVNEDFSTAFGSTPPGGWSTSFVPGQANPAELDGWVFNNPGAHAFPAPFAEPFAIVDSDAAGFGTSQDALMDTPRFDASTSPAVFLRLDQTHRAAGGSTVEIQVFDGTGFNTVLSSNTSSPNAATTMDSEPLSIDITSAAGGSADAFVRFRYTGSFGWWWTVDNVVILEPAPGVDIGVTDILTPSFTIECGALPMANTVTVEITNFAGAPLATGTMIPVAFSVDGGTPFNETMVLTAPLLPGQTTSFTFSATADLSAPGQHTLDAFTMDPADAVPGNDMASRSYVALPSMTLPFNEDFDSVGIGTTPPTDWINDPNDNGGGAFEDWFFSTGGTPSGVGPATDHTSGTGTFAFVEDSTSGSHPAINLLSPCIDLTTATTPVLSFWVWSNDVVGPSNTLSVDVISYPTGSTVSDVVGPIGNLGLTEWQCRGADLSAFTGGIVRLVFRGRNDNLSNFAHDMSIDDVAVFELAAAGQPPTPGVAVMDVANAVTGGCFGVDSGLAGPYSSSVTAGSSLAFEFEGGPNEAIILLEGALTPGNVDFPVVGKLDLGTPALGDIRLIADGSGGGFVNSLFVTGPGGTSTVAFPAPLFLLGQTLNFQSAIFNAMTGARFSNTVAVTFD